MFDWIPATPPFLEFIVLFSAAIAGLGVLKRFVWDPVAGFNHKVNAGMDTLLGYPEVTDPGSGTILKQATPPLARRVEQVEAAVVLMTENNKTVTRLEKEFERHLGWSEGWVQGIETRLTEVERVARQIEGHGPGV